MSDRINRIFRIIRSILLSCPTLGFVSAPPVFIVGLRDDSDNLAQKRRGRGNLGPQSKGEGHLRCVPNGPVSSDSHACVYNAPDARPSCKNLG